MAQDTLTDEEMNAPDTLTDEEMGEASDTSPQASPQPVQNPPTGWDRAVEFGKDVGGALKNAAVSTFEGAKDLATGGPGERLQQAFSPAVTPEARKRMVMQQVMSLLNGATGGLAPTISKSFEVLQGKRPEDPFAHQYGNEQVDWNKAYGQSSQAEPGLSLAGGFATNPVGLGGNPAARTAIAAGLNAAPALASGNPWQALVQGTAGGVIQGANEGVGAAIQSRDAAAAARKDAFGQEQRPVISGKAAQAQGQMFRAAQGADEGLANAQVPNGAAPPEITRALSAKAQLEANPNYQKMLAEHPEAQALHANIKANEAAGYKADLKKSNAQLADEAGYVDPQSAKYNLDVMKKIVAQSVLNKVYSFSKAGVKAAYHGAKGILPEVVQFLTSPEGAQSSVGLQNAKLMADPAYRQAMRDEDEKK